MDKYVSKSKADVSILGGDFNAGPVEHEGIKRFHCVIHFHNLKHFHNVYI